MKSIAYMILAALILSLGCKKPPVTPVENKVLNRKSADYSGDLAHDWLRLTDQLIRDNHLASPYAARIFGYVGLTLWESVCNGVPNGHSLANQVNGYKGFPIDASKEYDWGIVLSTAMATMLPEVIEQITSAQRDQIDVLSIVQISQLAATGVSFDLRDDSKSLGLVIGAKIVQLIHSDGREGIRNIIPVVPVRDAAHPWYWSPSTANQQPLEPLWGTLRSFVLDNAQSCAAAAPFPYSDQPGTAFFMDAQEVFQADRGSLHRSIAYHWEDGAGRTSGPAGHWINIANQLLQDSGKDLAVCAKTYCLLGCSSADAFYVAWGLKYKYFQMLPVTYLREQFSPSWKPLVENPPYPDYTSAAATIGGAAPLILAAVLGEQPFLDKTQLGTALYTPDGGPFVLPERSFESFTKAGEEEAISGIFGGIHFRRACDLGLLSGRCVGNTILARLQFGF